MTVSYERRGDKQGIAGLVEATGPGILREKSAGTYEFESHTLPYPDKLRRCYLRALRYLSQLLQ